MIRKLTITFYVFWAFWFFGDACFGHVLGKALT